MTLFEENHSFVFAHNSLCG